MSGNPRPRWQSISMLPVLAETIDGSLPEARETLANVRGGLGKPHVFDDRTVDRTIRLYTETLGMADVYGAQLGRWRGEAPDPAGLAEIDRLSAALPELEETARETVDAAGEIRKGTIDRIMELDDAALGRAFLSGKGFGRGWTQAAEPMSRPVPFPGL